MSTHETTTNTPSNVKPEDWMARAALFELLAMGLLMPTTNATEALVSGGFAEGFAKKFAQHVRSTPPNR